MKFHVILEANNSHLEIARLAQLAERYGGRAHIGPDSVPLIASTDGMQT